MKRFKRPITEVAKGMFHGGSEGPIIPNLGVNSKKAESSAPLKALIGPNTIEKAKSEAPKTQSQKNAETRKAGKAVSYKDAYADADKKKYKTYEEFEKAAKSYNKEKYNTTNPTADAKKAGKTKAQLAKDVAAKNAKDKGTSDTSNKVDQPTPKDKTVTKVDKAKENLKETKKQNKGDIKRVRKENKVSKITAKSKVAEAKGKSRKAERLADRAERKATGKTRKEQGRNIFGGKTRKQKKKEAAERLAAKTDSAAKYGKKHK
jgi:hypothetical protein